MTEDVLEPAGTVAPPTFAGFTSTNRSGFWTSPDLTDGRRIIDLSADRSETYPTSVNRSVRSEPDIDEVFLMPWTATDHLYDCWSDKTERFDRNFVSVLFHAAMIQDVLSEWKTSSFEEQAENGLDWPASSLNRYGCLNVITVLKLI